VDGRRRRNQGISVSPARVRKARIEAGLSLADVAGEDVSRTFIHFVEQGRSRPSESVLELIAERTGKPITYFTEGQTREDGSLGEMAGDLIDLANRLRRVVADRGLSGAEREAMRLVELSLRQGATISRTVEGRAKPTTVGRRRRPGAHSA